MKELDDLLLRLPVEIDEQVPAREQIELRERRVTDHTLDRKHATLPDLLVDAKPIALADKEALEPLGADVCRDALGIQTVSCELDDVRLDVCREHMRPGPVLRTTGELSEQDGQGVSLLPRRAG